MTQVLGGYAAARFGGKASLLFSIGFLSLGTMLIPTAARFDYRYLSKNWIDMTFRGIETS